MASELDHITLANGNQAFVDHLVGTGTFHDWLATAAFYKTVHVVEAVFASNMGKHSTSHNDRERRLRLPRFAALFKDYEHLLTASQIARYLVSGAGGGYRKFDDYLTAEEVRSKLIYRRLYGVEQKAIPFLSDAAKNALVKVQPPSK